MDATIIAMDLNDAEGMANSVLIPKDMFNNIAVNSLTIGSLEVNTLNVAIPIANYEVDYVYASIPVWQAMGSFINVL